MIRMIRRALPSLIAALMLLALPRPAVAAEGANYLIGRGITDITGPAVGVQMFGFVRPDQISEGIHQRLRARAFIIAEPGKDGARVAFVCADLGSVTYEIFRTVVERLEKKHGNLYTLDNVIVSATHTHSGPGGYWHYGSDTPIGGKFYKEHFEAIVAGIAGAIEAAHADLAPGSILINKGRVEGAGANRSIDGYNNNPAEERARYDTDTDKEMTLLRFTRDGGDIGMLNWFAVHPTSMTFWNKLISGDNKGYAAYRFERLKGATYTKPGEFVGAFAQTNCGDVTGNLNLNNTGPGTDEFDSTRIIGMRQSDRAVELFDGAKERIEGPIVVRREWLDFTKTAVGAEFTHSGEQHTCAAALGYPFAAGSTEDGGGLPMFKEGMKQRLGMVDSLIKTMAPLPTPTDGCRECQAPKVLLFAPGEINPLSYPDTVQISLVRIGQLVLIAAPGEFTTMSGRRIREAVQGELKEWAKYAVLAGYSNGYTGYVTTREEYETQQYEGGHTVFGPWTQAAYQQEFVKLAKAMASGVAVEPGTAPEDPRARYASAALGSEFDAVPDGEKFGGVISAPAASYKKGETARADFWSGNPSNRYATGNNYAAIERKVGGKWVSAAADGDWETKIRWLQPFAPHKPAPRMGVESQPKQASSKPSPLPTELLEKYPALKATPPPPGAGTAPADPSGPFEAMLAEITWDIPADAEAGTYRIVHTGCYKTADGVVHDIRAESGEFKVE